MKLLQRILAVVFIALLSISCSKEKDKSTAPTPTAAAEYFFKAKVDGVQYITANAAQVTGLRSKDAGGSITVASAIGMLNFNFRIDYLIGNGVATYSKPVPPTADYILRMEYGETGNTFTVGNCNSTGTLTISSISETEISGTFSFTASKSGSCPTAGKTITEGSFKTKILQ